MRKVFRLFCVKKEERWPALVALLVLLAFQALVICRYYYDFTPIVDNSWDVFVRHFNISGFDPITYEVVTHWTAKYNVYRHPLLAFFMFIPYLLNQALMALTGVNCALFIVAAMLVFSSFYSFLFAWRIFREIVGLSHFDACLLSAFFFSFAYILISSFVPDHFIMSMMMLLLILYVSGLKLQASHTFSTGESIALFVLTAGISLNNGLKVFFAELFANGFRRFFRPKYLLLAVIIPAALMWLFARWEYRTYVWPKEMAVKEAKAKRNKELTQKIYRDYADTAQVKDSAAIAAGVRKIVRQRAFEKYRRDRQKVWNKNTGKPIANGEFSRWTDITTPRWASVVENLFGESIQLHQDYLLQDTLRSRPLIVNYRWAFNYVVEVLVALLFLVGIWCGRRSRFLWLAMSFFALDMTLHVVFGFGLNEVFIMSAHWLYVVPIAIAFLVRCLAKKERALYALRALLLLLTLWLWGYNTTLLIQFLT